MPPPGNVLSKVAAVLFRIVLPYWSLEPSLNAAAVTALLVGQWTLVSAWVGYKTGNLGQKQAIRWAIVSVLVTGTLAHEVMRMLGYRMVVGI